MGTGRALDFFLLDLRQLDEEAIAAYNPPGPRTTGYDAHFREPVLVDEAGDGVGTVQRKEKDSVFVKATIDVASYEALAMGAGGNMPDTTIRVYVFLRDARAVGLVNDEGACTIRVADRVARILDRFKRVALDFPAGRPQVYVEEVKPAVVRAGLHAVELKLDVREQGVAQA